MHSCRDSDKYAAAACFLNCDHLQVAAYVLDGNTCLDEPIHAFTTMQRAGNESGKGAPRF